MTQRLDEVPSGRGNITMQNTYLLECSLLHIFREKESLWWTPLVAQPPAIPASDLFKQSQKTICQANWDKFIGQSQLGQSCSPLSMSSLVLANDVRRKWARGENSRRRELFSTIFFPSVWEDLVPDVLQPSYDHEERIVLQEDRKFSLTLLSY